MDFAALIRGAIESAEFQTMMTAAFKQYADEKGIPEANRGNHLATWQASAKQTGEGLAAGFALAVEKHPFIAGQILSMLGKG